MARYCFVSIIFLSLCVFSGYCNHLKTINGKLHIQVGTTSACRFAQMFMTQVVATYEKYKDYVTFEFTPWGRSWKNDRGFIYCQFGYTDCWANRVHRCALDILDGNQEAMVKYMQCEFTSPFPALTQDTLACALNVGVNIVAMDFCVGTYYGDNLAGPAEERTREAMAVIDRVPFVVFNKNISVADNNQVALRGLENFVCNILLNDPNTNVSSC